MLIRHKDAIKPSEITPEPVFRNRRQLLRDAGLAGSGLLLAAGCAAATAAADAD